VLYFHGFSMLLNWFIFCPLFMPKLYLTNKRQHPPTKTLYYLLYIFSKQQTFFKHIKIKLLSHLHNSFLFISSNIYSVLEQVWSLENDSSCLYLQSVTDAPSFLLCLPSLGHLAPQVGVVPAKDTPTLK